MAVSRTPGTITFGTGSAATATIAASGTSVCNAVAINETAIDFRITVKADNQGGTPAAGEDIDMKILYSVDGTIYEDKELKSAETPSLETDLVDPAQHSYVVSVGASHVKFHFENKGSGNTIKVSGKYIEKRAY